MEVYRPSRGEVDPYPKSPRGGWRLLELVLGSLIHLDEGWAVSKTLFLFSVMVRDCSAAEWRDLLQSRRQFWPTLTTLHASLVPVSAEALQRERRQMQAKHLWYNVDIRWSDLFFGSLLLGSSPGRSALQSA